MTDQHSVTEQGVTDAASSDSLEHLEQIAEHARLAIAQAGQSAEVTFGETASKVKALAEHEIVGVRAALAKVEGRIAELRGVNTPKPAEPRIDPDAPPQGPATT